MATQNEAKKAFNEGHDIRYRIKPSGTGARFGGWRSFRRAVLKGNPPWPWEMVGSPHIGAVEWQIEKKNIQARHGQRNNTGRETKQYFCIAQSGFAIFGVGHTPLGALRDANQWTERLSLQDVDVPLAHRHHGGMYLYRCTKGVYEKVKSKGGDIPFVEAGGWIRLPE
ncbi:MAG: hypothetical protein WC489_06260 [Patescibacteria group bacterium]|jgi:hypothetical protein